MYLYMSFHDGELCDSIFLFKGNCDQQNGLQYTVDSTQYTVHSTQYTVHSSYCFYDFVCSKLSSETRTTQEFYSEYNIEQIGPIRVQSESNSLSKSDVGLIVACLLLLVIIVLAIVLGFYFYKR